MPTAAAKRTTTTTKPPAGFDWIADRVRAELERRELSISQLARDTGIHREQLSYWLGGHRFLRSDLLAQVLEHLGLPLVPPRGKRRG
jgi:transcriptional regulator with XRE-family HTH domain